MACVAAVRSDRGARRCAPGRCSAVRVASLRTHPAVRVRDRRAAGARRRRTSARGLIGPSAVVSANVSAARVVCRGSAPQARVPGTSVESFLAYFHTEMTPLYSRLYPDIIVPVGLARAEPGDRAGRPALSARGGRRGHPRAHRPRPPRPCAPRHAVSPQRARLSTGSKHITYVAVYLPSSRLRLNIQYYKGALAR